MGGRESQTQEARLKRMDRRQTYWGEIDLETFLAGDHPARAIWEPVGQRTCWGFYGTTKAWRGERGPNGCIRGVPVPLAVRQSPFREIATSFQIVCSDKLDFGVVQPGSKFSEGERDRGRTGSPGYLPIILLTGCYQRNPKLTGM